MDINDFTVVFLNAKASQLCDIATVSKTFFSKKGHNSKFSTLVISSSKKKSPKTQDRK